MKTSYKILASALLCGMMAMQSCSDVELPEAANKDMATVTGLQQSLDGRTVTITWQAVSEAAGYAVYCNGEERGRFDASTLSYTEKLGYNTNYKFTVKYYTAAGLMSLGQTTETIYIEKPDTPEVSGAVGYLLVTNSIDELPSSERIAAQWFKENYVDTQKGAFVSLSALSAITPQEITALWVNFERIGIESGYQNLPLSADDIEALQDYATDGGNLYLTKHATQLAVGIGRTAYAPGIFNASEGAIGGDVWYCNAQMGTAGQWQYDRSSHQLFRGMTIDKTFYADHYAYPLIGMSYRTDNNCMWDLNACGFQPTTNTIDSWEEATHSTVLATWGQVVDYCCAGIVDFEPEGAILGRVLCNGLAAYQFQADNEYADNVFKMTKNALDYLSGYQEPKAAYLLLADRIEDLPDEERLAAELFQDEYVDRGDGDFVTESQLAHLNTQVYKCLWVHISRIGLQSGYQNLPLSQDAILSIKSYVEDGGNLYLSKHATQLVCGIGRCMTAPNIYNASEGAVGSDVWYCNAQMGTSGQWQYDRRSHPIFDGMLVDETFYTDHTAFPLIGASYRTDNNCMWDLNACGFQPTTNTIDSWEEAMISTVLATWGHVVDYCCAGIVEFEADGSFLGTVLCNGLAAYQFQADNQYGANIDRLTTNSIDYLLSK